VAKNEKIDLFFPIWLTYHIVPLSHYSLYGSYDASIINSESSNTTGYGLIVSKLKEWVNRGGKTVQLNHLMYRFLTYWGFNFDVAIIFYNHWLPKMDKNLEGLFIGRYFKTIFATSCKIYVVFKNFAVTDLDCYSSVENWLSLIQLLCRPDQNSEAKLEKIIACDSFLSFIRLFAGHAQLSSGKDWKKLKSNIFMKMTPKVVADFGEIGLLRMSTLYLAVGFVTSDTSSMVNPTSLYFFLHIWSQIHLF